MTNIFLSANKSQIERMNQLFSYIRESRPLDSIIRTKDTVDTDKYTVDIFESGYGQPATKMAIDAFAISPSEAYEVNWPAKINYKDGSAFIRPELYPLFLKPKTPVDTSVNNRIEGWPCDQDGACDSSISDSAKSIFLNFAFPGTETAKNPDSGNTMAWLWFKYPRPVTVGSYKSAGVVLFGAASLKPSPGKLVTAWAPGNTGVTLTPCVGFTDPTPVAGAANIIAQIHLPATPPPCFQAAVGTIMGYISFVDPPSGATINVLISPPLLPYPTNIDEVFANAAASASPAHVVAKYITTHA